MSEELNVVNIPISMIEIDSKQPRKHFDEEELRSLADSISKYGVLSPINVRKKGMTYIIIAGERRWRASRLAGLKTIPAKIENVDDKTHRLLSLIENIQREDLNPIEEGIAFKNVMEQYGMTQEELSSSIGKSRSYIANSVRLINLEPEIQEMLIYGKLTSGHAKVLLSLSDPVLRLAYAKQCVDSGLSVKELEKLIKEHSKKKNKKENKKDPDQSIISLSADQVARRLSDHLATKVSIQYNQNKTGHINIEFYSDDDFNEIISKLSN